MNLQEITSLIVLKAFPDLLQERIHTEYALLEDSFFEYGILGKDYFIEVKKSLETVDDQIVIGGIAHELCHIARDKKKGFFDSFLYKHNKYYRYMDERQTDLDVVLRGYGKNLMAFLKFRETQTLSYENEGITLIELEKLRYTRW